MKNKPFDICRIGAKVTNEGQIGNVHWLEFDDGIRLVWTPDLREGNHACFYERIEESWVTPEKLDCDLSDDEFQQKYARPF